MVTLTDPGLRISRGGQKRLKISLFSVSFFDRFGSSKWIPKCTNIELQRPPRRSWSQVAAGCYFGSHFGLIFGPPEPLKIVLSLWRGAIFRKNGMTRPGAQNGAPNDPQIEPQTTPRDLQIAKKIPPNRRLIVGQISAQLLTILGGPK